eukprot:1160777-Pelagomonas_calceolata.AAC.3
MSAYRLSAEAQQIIISSGPCERGHVGKDGLVSVDTFSNRFKKGRTPKPWCSCTLKKPICVTGLEGLAQRKSQDWRGHILQPRLGGAMHHSPGAHRAQVLIDARIPWVCPYPATQLWHVPCLRARPVRSSQNCGQMSSKLVRTGNTRHSGSARTNVNEHEDFWSRREKDGLRGGMCGWDGCLP